MVQRTTEDCDVLDPGIASSVLQAAEAFADERGIDRAWFNCKAHVFVTIEGCVPEGLRERLRTVFRGKALKLQTLGAQDLLCTKLVALIDRGTDFDDCVALQPTANDLVAAWPFVAEYEGNPESRAQYWIPLARMQMQRLAKRLGYDVVL